MVHGEMISLVSMPDTSPRPDAVINIGLNYSIPEPSAQVFSSARKGAELV